MFTWSVATASESMGLSSRTVLRPVDFFPGFRKLFIKSASSPVYLLLGCNVFLKFSSPEIVLQLFAFTL